MQNDTLMIYKRLRDRIISNEELSDEEWEVFFQIEEETKALRIHNHEWHKLLLDSMVLEPSEKSVQAKLASLEPAASEVQKEELISQVQPAGKEGVLEAMSRFLTDLIFGKKNLVYAFSTAVLAISAFFLLVPDNPERQFPEVNERKAPHKPHSVSLQPASPPGVVKYDEKQLNSTSRSENSDFAESLKDEHIKTAQENFEINPYLEEYSSDATRAGTIFVTMDFPVRNAVFTAGQERNNRINILFKGSIKGFEVKPDTFVMLKIFNNKINSYIEDSPLYKQSIPFELKGDAAFFKAELGLILTPGLYYYTLEEIHTDDLIQVGSFRVE